MIMLDNPNINKAETAYNNGVQLTRKNKNKEATEAFKKAAEIYLELKDNPLYKHFASTFYESSVAEMLFVDGCIKMEKQSYESANLCFDGAISHFKKAQDTDNAVVKEYYGREKDTYHKKIICGIESKMNCISFANIDRMKELDDIIKELERRGK